MSGRQVVVLMMVSALLPLVPGVGWHTWADEEQWTEVPAMGQTMNGLHFDIPVDWPVERRHGIVAPIPIEEYLAIKFGKLDTHLAAFERRVNKLDLRLHRIEDNLKAQEQGLRSTEPSSPGPGD